LNTNGTLTRAAMSTCGRAKSNFSSDFFNAAAKSTSAHK
jgi:hypothetical protein